MQRLIALFIALTISTALSATAKDVLLRLSPSADALVIARVPHTDDTVKNAAQLADPFKAQYGWFKSNHRSNWEGYLPSANVSKNYEIKLGTPIFDNANLIGIALTQIEGDDQIEILQVADVWTKVRVQKTLTVYFQRIVAPTPAPRLAKPVTQLQPLPVYVKPQFDPSLGVGSTKPEALPPENVVWVSAPHTPITVSKPEPSNAPQPPTSLDYSYSETAPATLPSSDFTSGRIYRLSGILIREIDNNAPRYALKLKNDLGQLVAYVDMSQLYLEEIRPYLDQNVYIHGEVNPIELNSQLPVITARTLRIRE